MDAAPQTVSPPRPTHLADGRKRADIYVPEWFPEDTDNKDEERRSAQRASAYYTWVSLADGTLRDAYLEQHKTTFLANQQDSDELESSFIDDNINDSPPRPRKLVKRLGTPPLKRSNNNAKRARTLRRRQNHNYLKVYNVLEPLRQEMQLPDKQFMSLVQRYKREVKESQE